MERGSDGIEEDFRSGASSRATPSSMSPRIPRTAVSKRGGGGSGDVGESGESMRVPAVAAQRKLALAPGGLNMVGNVTGIAWIVLKRMYSPPSLLFFLSFFTEYSIPDG